MYKSHLQELDMIRYCRTYMNSDLHTQNFSIFAQSRDISFSCPQSLLPPSLFLCLSLPLFQSICLCLCLSLSKSPQFIPPHNH